MSNSQKVSSDVDAPLGFVLHWQDFTTHKFGGNTPAAHQKFFPTRADALAHLAELRMYRSGIVASVVPVHPKLARDKNHSLADLPRMVKRLTR